VAIFKVFNTKKFIVKDIYNFIREMAYLCPETLDYAEEKFPGFKVKWAKNLLRKEKDA
jgi:hypothetical protein